jgi:glycosyltransferase 2 family protein
MKQRHWVVSAAVILLVLYAARKVDWSAAGTILSRAAVAPLVAAILVNIFSVALRGVRWWIFLRRVGVSSMPLAIRGAIVGAGFNNLLVANGGDAARALLVARASGATRTAVLATLVLDRIFDPFCFGLLLFVATFIMPLPAQLSHARPIAGVALIVVIALLAALVKAPERAVGAAASDEGWRSRARAFRQQAVGLATARRFVPAAAISIAIWALQIVTFGLAARSVGIALPLAGDVSAMLLTNAGLVLRATPGNVGYFQFAYAVAVSRFGVATESAVAAAVLLQMVQIIPTTLLAVALAPGMFRANGGTAAAE